MCERARGAVQAMAARAVLVAALVCSMAAGMHALYFHIQESETKCFSEELPDETVVVGE